MAIDIILPIFSDHKVPVVYLESDKCDEKMKNDINFITLHQDELHEVIDKKTTLYTNENYNKKSFKLELVKTYLLPDIQNEYGFLFDWLGDTEHGIGVKTKNLLVKEIGGTETVFL